MVRLTTTLRKALHEGSLTFARYSPGRFFAANELKALLAFLVLNYDFRLAEGTERPPNVHHAELVVPNPNTKLLFRKRQSPVAA